MKLENRGREIFTLQKKRPKKSLRQQNRNLVPLRLESVTTNSSEERKPHKNNEPNETPCRMGICEL